MATAKQLTYTVPGVNCGHCAAAIEGEVGKVGGVSSVDVDLTTKQLTVRGDGLDADSVSRAIDDAGYDAEPA